jgi:hypothetical protein
MHHTALSLSGSVSTLTLPFPKVNAVAGQRSLSYLCSG